jgi:uncharacterized protein (TIGR03083 family)
MRSDQVMDSPDQMAAAYRTEMRRLLDAVARIPADRLGAPIHGDWTVQEILVHLAGWDRAVAGSADDVLAGRPARLIRMRLEDVNDDIVDSRRSAPLARIQRELAEAHQGLLDRLAAIPPEQWLVAVPDARWPDGSPMTPASVFAYRYRDQTHYGGHADEIEAWTREHSG